MDLAYRIQTKHIRARRQVIFILACVFALVGATSLVYYHATQAARPDPGVTLQSYEGISDEEIQKMLNKQTDASRMIISVAPEATLDEGRVRVNVINDGENSLSQRFELVQDGQVLYRSGVIEPGSAVEWCEASAHTGTATLSIQAVTSEGVAQGNPQAIEIELVDKAE